MEINQCNEDEYRCHNGMCIQREFYPHCLDRSDEKRDFSYSNPRFVCEEHSCPIHWKQFSCEDGQCVHKFGRCYNGRHLLLINSFSSPSDHCQQFIHCLTMFTNEIFCKQYFVNSSIIDQCDDIISYPSIPIHLSHLTFLYKKSSLIVSNLQSILLPDYVCYNEHLCDCLSPSYFYRNFSCLPRNSFRIELNISGNALIDLIFELNHSFSSCLLPYHHLVNDDIISNNSSLYFCQNSSKYLSKLVSVMKSLIVV